MSSHAVLAGKVQVYRRPNSRFWHCSASLGRFYTENTHARLKLESVMGQHYAADECQLRQDIDHLDNVLKNSSGLRIWWLEWRKKIPKDAELELQNMRRSLENIEWRKSEAQQALDRDIAEQRQLIRERQLRERHELDPMPVTQDYRGEGPSSEDFDEDLGPAFDIECISAAPIRLRDFTEPLHFPLTTTCRRSVHKLLRIV